MRDKGPKLKPKTEKQDGDDLAKASVDLLYLVEDFTDGIVVFDSAGQYLFANREAERLLGLSRENVVGRTFWDVFPTEPEKIAFPQQFETVLQEQSAATFNAFSDAISRWLQLRLVPCSLPRTEGEPGVIVYFRDVTERLEAERSRAESEERFHILADCAPVLIWMAGEDRLCNWFNKPWLAFTGRTMEQEIGSGWAEGVHTDDSTACSKIYRESFDAGVPFTREYRLRRHDGVWRWLLDNGTPRYDESGNFFGFIGSCTDVTALKESEANAARLLAERTALAERQAELLLQQRAFLKDVLYAVTDGTFILCDSATDLPEPLSAPVTQTIPLTTASALRHLREDAKTAAANCSLSEESVSDLVTAASEAGMNVVSHTKGRGQARTHCHEERGIVQVWVEDSGPGIPIETLHRAVLERGWTTLGSLGHGFYMMLECADCIYLLTGDGSDGAVPGTTVVLEKHRTPPTPKWIER